MRSLPAEYFVDPTSLVDEHCSIGEGTKIWHFCHVMTGARIGRNCTFGQNCFVGPGVVIGDNVKIQNNVSIYEGVELESDVFCGPSSVFTNIINPRSQVVRRGHYLRTLVRRGATIGGNATIICGNTIGPFSFIAAGAVVTHAVPAHALMIGVPARQVGWMSRYGHRLEFGPDRRARCCESGEEYLLTSDNQVEQVSP
jgi:UDP-2-acetamido-3-amino-2,3-dideoxy-glucuronate N-acetyltransferase